MRYSGTWNVVYEVFFFVLFFFRCLFLGFGFGFGFGRGKGKGKRKKEKKRKEEDFDYRRTLVVAYLIPQKEKPNPSFPTVGTV